MCAGAHTFALRECMVNQPPKLAKGRIVDKYRRQGMEYRFHDNAAPVPKPVGSPQMQAQTPAGSPVETAPGSADEPDAAMQDNAGAPGDGHQLS